MPLVKTAFAVIPGTDGPVLDLRIRFEAIPAGDLFRLKMFCSKYIRDPQGLSALETVSKFKACFFQIQICPDRRAELLPGQQQPQRRECKKKQKSFKVLHHFAKNPNRDVHRRERQFPSPCGSCSLILFRCGEVRSQRSSFQGQRFPPPRRLPLNSNRQWSASLYWECHFPCS